jgi:hypothetical protein
MALKFANNNSLSAITSLPASISGGALTLLQTQTASSSATIDFTSNIDSTYDAYMFKFINIHPATDGVTFQFQASTNGGSSYGVTTTNTLFQAYHNEADGNTALSYDTGDDIAQGTGFISLVRDDKLGADADQCAVGTLHLFNPSNTTFVKHYIATTHSSHLSDFSLQCFTAGYFNTTSAIDGIQFKAHSGAIESGVIKLYGIS